MSSLRPRMSDLAPEALELLALEHIAGAFVELRATCRAAREQVHPLQWARRHPIAAAALAAAAALLLARSLGRRPSARSTPEAAARAPAGFDSLLSRVAAAAGRQLPGLLACWLSHSKPD